MPDRSPGHRTITVDVDAVAEDTGTHVSLPWYLVAGLGALLVVAAGWLLMAGAATMGWLTSVDTALSDALHLASDLLFLAHGASVVVGGQSVSIPPLTVTLALVLLGQPVTAYAARQAAAAMGEPDDTGALWVDPEPIVWRIVAVFAGTWIVAIAGLAIALQRQDVLLPVVLGAATMGVISAGWGASRELRFDPRSSWPAWLRTVPMAMVSALLVCLVGGAAMLTMTLFLHRDRMASIHDSLGPELAGTVLLVLLQLLYLPNLILWATSWVLGGGITLGDDSLVAMAVTDVGFLPAIPVLGAIPEPGGGSAVWYWWLLVGVVAGAVAAFAVAWGGPRARFDEITLAGGLAGVAAGLLVSLLAAFASGGLGEGRLAWIGARTRDLLIVAPSLLGLSGIVVGVVVGALRTDWPALRERLSNRGDEPGEET